MKGCTRYLHRSRVFLRATEGDFIDACVVRGLFCVVSEGFYLLFASFAGVFASCRRRFYRYLRRSRHVLRSEWRGFTRYLRRSRVFLGATEGDFIDICVVHGMFCVVGEGFYSLFTLFARVFKSCRRRL